MPHEPLPASSGAHSHEYLNTLSELLKLGLPLRHTRFLGEHNHLHVGITLPQVAQGGDAFDGFTKTTVVTNHKTGQGDQMHHHLLLVRA